MEHKRSHTRTNIMERLLEVPRTMALLHGRENVTEFVLNQLCHPECFNFKRAAYFVDNPDFNYFKGVAGYNSDDICITHPELCWEDPDSFSKKMQAAAFNQKVRGFSTASPSLQKKSEKELIEYLSESLSLHDPGYHSWHLKNNNHGLLIFEHGNGIDRMWEKEDLEKGVYLLSFCPIF